MKHFRVGVVLLAVLAILAAALYYLPYSTRSYRGDGEATDRGFWSYPQYVVRFPAVSLSEPGEYTFTCRGLPPVPLNFYLRVLNDVKDDKYALLRGLQTRVAFTLSEESGAKVCEATGPLKDWKLAWGTFGQPSCRAIEVRRGQGYRLTLTVTGIDPNSPPLSVEPMFTGGGLEPTGSGP
jgi:hypothetical protein